jgi:hypothetical protein
MGLQKTLRLRIVSGRIERASEALAPVAGSSK